MTADEWRRVRDLFERALDREPAGVPRWLDEEAGGEPAIRDEVRALFESHLRAGSFLSEPLASAAPDLLADDDALAEGAMVGAYRIERHIGSGGMGRVYLATDTRLGRRVALKALPAHLSADGRHRSRLQREAMAAAALAHPGICAVYALEEIDGTLFIASEFVDGRTLRDEMASGRPTAASMLEIARELAAALASAHARGITHRDLKPENVMRTAGGRLKILDFGLARIEDGAVASGPDGAAARLTEPGVLVGTPDYMAPEQLNGQQADARSDVFSCGVLLYEYACGVHPFEAQTPLARAARVLESAARPLDAVRPDVPPTLADAIDRCLQKAPADRWPSAVDLALALARAPEAPRRPASMTRWWRAHQLAVMALYALAAIAAWAIKERVHGLADAAFVAAGIAGTTGGIVRGHLIFTEWMNRSAIDAERSRADRLTLAADVLVAAALAVCGVLIASRGPLPAMLSMALAAALILARTLLEPATAAAVFGAGGPRGSAGAR